MKARAYLAPLVPRLATLAWAFLAFVVGQVAALAALFAWAHGDLRALVAQPYDGAVVTLSVLVLDPVTVAVLVLAVCVRGAGVAEYLGLVWPRMPALSIGIVGIVAIIALTDALLFVSGQAIVSPFQLISYTTAAREGWLPLMWLATVIVAPAGEEIMFRGFLFRGWVSSRRSAWIAVPLISLLWTGLHVQYDWAGMLEIFVAGLFLGWVRWSSGSTLLTFGLHALLNLEGMLETLVQVRHVL
ncbi:MAG: CPBP family intramembrane glutamic endopeptidase [Xanthobacteraceae bacterium]